ncbi:hypothetical protein ACIRVF_41690 [Kitasatospora sp. NPDC101157]|uniref:hypothetical protein n=1 Tax=Kitasatospora sp. NPDC101157 TaxID=3364098 RepID=UPI0038119CD8
MDRGVGAMVGGRLVGAAVAGALVLGGGVVAAGPAVAVPGVRPTASAGASGPAGVRTVPGREQSVRTGLRAHQITDHTAVSRRRHKTRRSVVGRALDAVFGWLALAVLVVVLVVVLAVYAVRRRRSR